MSRRLRYQVAVSLDGFIAGPNGESDGIVMDPAIAFAALFKEFDTAVMGRKTYEVMTAQGGHRAMPGLDVVVFSRTLPAADQKTLPASGIVVLSYSVPRGVGPAPRIRYIKAARTRRKKGLSTGRKSPKPTAAKKRPLKKGRWRA